jgi:hypothetical protein
VKSIRKDDIDKAGDQFVDIVHKPILATGTAVGGTISSTLKASYHACIGMKHGAAATAKTAVRKLWSSETADERQVRKSREDLRREHSQAKSKASIEKTKKTSRDLAGDLLSPEPVGTRKSKHSSSSSQHGTSQHSVSQHSVSEHSVSQHSVSQHSVSHHSVH